MVTAVSLALALAFEPAERNVMRRHPRESDEPLVSRFLLWRIGFVSVLLTIGALGHYLFMLDRSSPRNWPPPRPSTPWFSGRSATSSTAGSSMKAP
jgi:magnesium-transporting ATPase (P-type)